MAKHKSALKKTRADERRRVRNRTHASRLRTTVKRFRAAVSAGELDAAEGMLGETFSTVDRTARLGVIRANTASRTKSRLSSAIAKLRREAAEA